VERPVLDLALGIGRQRLAEHFQRLVLGRGGERKVAGVGQHLARLHPLRDRLVHRVLGVGTRVFILRRGAKRLAHRRRGLAALAGVGLVDDDGEGLAAFGRDLVEDEGELLHRRNDDLLPLLNELAQVAGARGVTHGRAHLHELLDGVLDLVVEQAPVGHHDDRVENLLVVALQTDELVREPGN